MMSSNEQTKPLKVSLLTNMVAPYRVPLFRALAKDAGVEWLRILTCVEREVDRQWEVNNDSSYTVKQLAGITLNLRRRGTDALRIIHLRFGIFWELLLHRPDRLIIGDASWTSYLAVLACLLLRIPYVVWNEITTSSKVREGVLTKVRCFMYRYAYTCIASGRLAKDFLLKHECEDNKIYIARNAVDNDYYFKKRKLLEPRRSEIRSEIGLSDNDFAFLFVGQLISRKRILETARVIGNIPRENKIHLIVAGDGPLHFVIKNEIAEKEFRNIKFFGHMEKNDICKLYVASDALILLSDDEPWGMVVNEALLFGKRFLCSEFVGAACELGTSENGLITGSILNLERTIANFVKFCRESNRLIDSPPSPAAMAQEMVFALTPKIR